MLPIMSNRWAVMFLLIHSLDVETVSSVNMFKTSLELSLVQTWCLKQPIMIKFIYLVKRSPMLLYGLRKVMSQCSHQVELLSTRLIRWYVLFATPMTQSSRSSTWCLEAIQPSWMKTCKKIFLPNGKNGSESLLKTLKTIMKWSCWMLWSTFQFIL